MLPTKKSSFYRYVNALQSLVSEGTSDAALLAETVLKVWLKSHYPRLSRAALKSKQSLLTDPTVQSFATWLGTCELLDGAFWLSSAYARWAGEKVRSTRAMFFTPPILSERLVNDAITNGANLTKHLFLDPACGGAAFLTPLAIRLRKALKAKGLGPNAILKHVCTHLMGVEIDRALCRLSRVFLKMALYEEIIAAKQEPQFNIHNGNSLTSLSHLYGKIDVILCNPPYRKMPRAEVAQYRPLYNAVIRGQPNLYSLFFVLGLRLLRNTGVAGFLTPTGFLSGQYFSELRTYLLNNANPAQIDILNDRLGVFVAVEQETVISVLKKRTPKRAKPEHTNIFILTENNHFANVGCCVLPNSGHAWPVPRITDDFETILAAYRSPFRLEHYGYVPRIGALVWNRDKRQKFYTEKDAATKAKAPFPLIWSRNVGHTTQHAFSDRKTKERYTFVDMKRPDHSSVVRRPSVMLQRVTSSDQPRRLVAAPVDMALLKRFGGVVGENHVVFLEQISAKPALSLTQLSAVLRSAPIDRLFRCISGATNVSVFELSQLPMPDPVVLQEQLKNAINIDTAVMRAFRLYAYPINHTIQQDNLEKT